MNILILSVYPFPIGFSATNRIISYSKGLIELGNKVTNIIIRPTEKDSTLTNINPTGCYEGIEYIYSTKNTKWSNNFSIKILQLFYGFFSSLFLLKKLKNEDKIDIIIVSINNLFYNYSYIVFSKLFLKKKIIFISDEYPFVLRKNRFPYRYFPFLIRIVENWNYRFFDGIVVMTKSLQEYFREKTKNKLPVQLVLMTVELERFNLVKSKINSRYLAYVGDLTLEKDGLDILINAFKKIIQKFPNYKLKIAGSTKNSSDILVLKEIVNELKINEQVEFTGKIARDSVPEFLINAEALLLSRPNSDRSRGGFPTKLGEYLATGNPVIVTSVGEIPEYLEDGKNAFLVKPDCVECFAEKIAYVLENPILAAQVGLRGKFVAEKIFNYKVQSSILNRFLEKFLNEKD